MENASRFSVEDIDDGHPGPYNDFNGITSKYGAHFILSIDKILMKPEYYRLFKAGEFFWICGRMAVKERKIASGVFWHG